VLHITGAEFYSVFFSLDAQCSPILDDTTAEKKRTSRG
jgi:hypothetical protein